MDIKQFKEARAILKLINKKQALQYHMDYLVKEEGEVNIKFRRNTEETVMPKEVVQYWNDLLQTQIDELTKQFEAI